MVVKTEQATVEEVDEPMKIEIIPMNGMQVINIPVNGNITIINPSMIQSSSGTWKSSDLQWNSKCGWCKNGNGSWRNSYSWRKINHC